MRQDWETEDGGLWEGNGEVMEWRGTERGSRENNFLRNYQITLCLVGK